MRGIFVNNVSFQYTAKKKELNNITVEIPAGSFCGITGANGSGKTTFTLLLNGLIPHEVNGKFSGNVFIDGINTRKNSVGDLAKSVGIVFQNPDFMIFNLTIYDEIAFGLKNLGYENIEKRISGVLKQVGLDGYETIDPHILSFGQKQKLCLAVALAMDPSYIVLDEPSAMLDYKSTLHLYETLEELNKKGKTIIIVEHDTDFLLNYCHQVLIFEKGQIVLQGKTQDVFEEKDKLLKLKLKMPQRITNYSAIVT